MNKFPLQFFSLLSLIMFASSPVLLLFFFLSLRIIFVYFPCFFLPTLLNFSSSFLFPPTLLSSFLPSFLLFLLLIFSYFHFLSLFPFSSLSLSLSLFFLTFSSSSLFYFNAPYLPQLTLICSPLEG